MITSWCILPFASSRGEELFFNASFEAPEYSIGTLDGQSGWKVDQGRAEIQLGEGRMGSAGLVLLPEEPFSQARLQLATDIGFNQTLFLDVYVRPVASDAAEKEEMIDINSARIGVFNDSSAEGASIWVFDGDVNGGGKWVRTSEKVAIDKASGRAAQWLRLTVRQDLEGHSWDLWVDGKWAAAGMGLQVWGCRNLMHDRRKAPTSSWVTPLGECRWMICGLVLCHPRKQNFSHQGKYRTMPQKQLNNEMSGRGSVRMEIKTQMGMAFRIATNCFLGLIHWW
jgi:hypothetical protein